MSHVSPALYATLAELVPELHVHCVAPWCLIGAAAALLAGARVHVTGVDVLTSPDDAARLIGLWPDRREHADQPTGERIETERFGARIARLRFPGLPVQIVSALAFKQADGRPSAPQLKLTLAGLNGLAVPMPCIADQIRLNQQLGRERDLACAQALRVLSSAP